MEYEDNKYSGFSKSSSHLNKNEWHNSDPDSIIKGDKDLNYTELHGIENDYNVDNEK